MSEKSKHARSAERSKVAAHGSKERYLKEKQQTAKKPVEDVRKMAEKLIEEDEEETSPIIKAASKFFTFDKPEDPEAGKVTSKSVSETSVSSKPEDPEAEKITSKSVSETSASSKPEDLEAEKVTSKSMFEMSASSKPEDPEAEKVMSKSVSDMSSSGKPEDSEATEMPKSEISTSVEPEIPEVQKVDQTSEKSICVELETPEVPEVSQMPKPTETSSSVKPETPEVETAEFVDGKFSETCQKSKTIFEIFHSKVKFPEVSKECGTSEIRSFQLEASEIPEPFEISKTMSETSTSTELEAPKTPEIPEINEMSIDMSKLSISDKSENCEVPEACQMPKATSEKSIAEHEVPKMPEVAEVSRVATSEIFTSESKDYEVPEACEMLKTMSPSTIFEAPEISQECQLAKIFTLSKRDAEAPELRQTRSMSKISIAKEDRRVPDGHPMRSNSSQAFIPVKRDDPEKASQMHSSTTEMYTLSKSEDEMNSTKDIEDKSAENPTKKFKESSPEETKSPDNDDKKTIYVFENTKAIREMMARRKVWPPISMPNFKEPHLVLATHHLVPSLPVELFEVFAEMIEVVTKRPVVLLHECRPYNRPVATEVVDIAVMPAAESWKNGVLLPASFVFKHPLNNSKSADVYADVIVAKDRASYIKDVMDLRGHMCVIPNKGNRFTAAGYLFNHLKSKGENPLFFGNVFDAKTHLEVMKMVISKQAQVGVLESPVITCHKYGELDVDSLHVLTSVGPMPPYRIMVKESLATELNEKLATYLLNTNKYEVWLERLLPFGIIGFAKNSTDYYKSNEVEEEHVVINVPYY